MVLSGCGLGAISGLVQGELSVVPRSAHEWLTQSPPGQVIFAINVVVTAVAGLALMVFGMGLQQEVVRSGNGAVLATVLLAAGWWATTIAAIVWAPTFFRIALNLIMAGAATFLVLLALAARRELRLNPPPPPEPVTPEFLAQFDGLGRLKRDLDDAE